MAYVIHGLLVAPDRSPITNIGAPIGRYVGVIPGPATAFSQSFTQFALEEALLLRILLK